MNAIYSFVYLLLLILPFTVFAEISYEPNNTLEDALPLYVNDPSQSHKFDYMGDEDWLVFYAHKGTPYNIDIESDSVGKGVNPAISLYDNNGNVEVILFNFNFSGEGELLDWTAPASGFYYIKVSNEEPGFSEDGHYKIKIFLPLSPLQGRVKGEILDECTQKGLNKIEMSANKETTDTLVDQKLSHENGGYSIPLDPGKYRITARSSGYQSKTLVVSVKEAESAPLKFELLPAGGCSTDSDDMPKSPPLDPENFVGVYDKVSGVLMLKDIRIGSGIITASLQLQADSSLKLISVEPLNSGVFNSPAFYDFDGLLVDIPATLAFDQLFYVQLKVTSSAGTFKLEKAEPLARD